MNYLTRLLAATLFGSLLSTSAFSQHASFARVRVADGPTLEFPAHWVLMDEANVQNRVHSGQAIADAAGIDLSGFQKRSRVIIESLPRPNAAQIRASIVIPQEYTQQDLSKATPEELRGLKKMYETTFRKASASMTVKLHKMGEVRIDKIAGHIALVIPYITYSEESAEKWQFEQIKIPFENKLLSMTVSYRVGEHNTMKPILERVKQSLKF